MNYTGKYFRVEITFNSEDPEETLLYLKLLEESKDIGKAKYLKKLLKQFLK